MQIRGSTIDGSTLVSPYGGELVDLVAPAEAVDDLKAYGATLPSQQLSNRSVCDLELLATGAFSPLDRFMGHEDQQCVLDEMRLTEGSIFPIPVTLAVEPNSQIHFDRDVALRDPKNDLLAIMTIEEIYEWDRDEVAQKVLGTQDFRHPLIAEMSQWPLLNISGSLRVANLPRHYDFRELRMTPLQTRARLEGLGYSNVVGFQTRNPLHRAHEELIRRALSEMESALLLHPAVGLTKPGDVDHYTRVRTYKALAAKYYDPGRILLSLLPLAMRMAGPREALWHAIIRRNYGANHLIVGRDHAGPGLDSTGSPFYGPYDAQDLVQRHGKELGVNVVSFRELVYAPEEDRYLEVNEIPSEGTTVSFSGTDVRERYLQEAIRLPEWYARPEVAEILSEVHPPRHRQGVCIWLTGLPCAGKSTTAEVLTALLLEHGRRVTLLDGDVVRTHLSRGLGFEKADRDTNIRRIGFVASEIVRHGGVVICAAISPYRSVRNEVRWMIGAEQFMEVYVNTPLAVCEARDTKGLYERARKGEITDFTGIDHPYEPPKHPEIVLHTIDREVEDNAMLVLDYLIERGFVRAEADSDGNGYGYPHTKS